METRLRTSFVPKKTLVVKSGNSEGGGSMNPIMSLSVIVFFMTIALAGGEYLYNSLLQKQIEQSRVDLVKARESFEEKTIAEWKRRDNRLRVANNLLAKHVVISPIFSILEDATLQTTRFVDFDFSSVRGNLAIKMKGEGLSYTSVALLSDSFNHEPGIKNPIFSDLKLSTTGGVDFSFTGTLIPSVVSYKDNFENMNTNGNTNGDINTNPNQ